MARSRMIPNCAVDGSTWGRMTSAWVGSRTSLIHDLHVERVDTRADTAEVIQLASFGDRSAHQRPEVAVRVDGFISSAQMPVAVGVLRARPKPARSFQVDSKCFSHSAISQARILGAQSLVVKRRHEVLAGARVRPAYAALACGTREAPALGCLAVQVRAMVAGAKLGTHRPPLGPLLVLVAGVDVAVLVVMRAHRAPWKPYPASKYARSSASAALAASTSHRRSYAVDQQ